MLRLVNNDLDLLCDNNEYLIEIYMQFEKLNREVSDSEIGGQSDESFEDALVIMGLDGAIFSEKEAARLKLLYRKSWSEEQKEKFIDAMMSI